MGAVSRHERRTLARMSRASRVGVSVCVERERETSGACACILCSAAVLPCVRCERSRMTGGGSRQAVCAYVIFQVYFSRCFFDFALLCTQPNKRLVAPPRTQRIRNPTRVFHARLARSPQRCLPGWESSLHASSTPCV